MAGLRQTKAGRFLTVVAFALTLAVAVFAAPVANAACSGPAGNAGDIAYSSSQNIMVYCNGTNWIGMGGASAVNFGTLTIGDFCTATSGTAISCTTATINLSSQASGTLQAAQFPALTGDITTTAGSLATTIGANKVTMGDIAQIAGLSVIGNATNATANVTPITGTANQVLVVNSAGTGLAFGALNLSSSAAVTGTLLAAQEPAHTGDVTNSAGSLSMTVGSIGGQTVTLGGALTTAGAFTTSGAYPITLTATGTTNVTLPTSGTLLSTTSSIGTSSITGVLAVPNGGTGDNSLPQYSVLLGNGMNAVNSVGPGNAGQLLIAEGTSANPAFQTVGGDLTMTGLGSATVAKIQGTTVSGVTGTGNVVFSAAPTLSGSVTLSGLSSAGVVTTNGSGVLATNATLPAAEFPSLTGDVTNSGLTTTVGKIGGNAVSLGGAFTTSGGAITLTTSGGSNVVVPASGTLLSTTSSIGTSQITGTYGVASGGTGDSSLTQYAVLVGNGTGAVNTVGPGATGTVLVGGGGSANPSFSASPSLTGLTLSGTEVVTFGVDYTTTGTQADVALNANSAIRYNGNAAATFYGIVAGAPGQILYLHNASSYALTLSNQSGSEGTTANQIITGTGSDMVMASNSSATLQYDGTANRWRVIGGSGGGIPAGTTGQVQFNSGSNSFAASSNLYWDNTNSRLAIGTSAAPLSTLDLYGGVAVGTSYAGVTAAPTNGLIVVGSAGIGTSSPTAKLSLGGQQNWVSGLGVITQLVGPSDQAFAVASGNPVGPAGGNNLTFTASNGAATANTGPQNGGNMTFTAGNAGNNNSGSGAFGGGFTFTAGTAVNTGTGGSFTVTAGPAGGTNGSNNGNGGGVSLTAGLGGNDNPHPGGSGGAVTIKSGAGQTTTAAVAAGNSGSITLASGNAGNAASGTGGNSGNIIIQTGTAGTGSTAGTAGTISMGVGGTTNMTISSAGSVGIGTTSPLTPEQISAASVASKGMLTVVDTAHASTSASLSSAISGFGNDIGSGSTGRSWYIGNDGGSQQFDIYYAQSGPMAFYTGGTQQMTIGSNGSVATNHNTLDDGSGNTSIAGNATVTGSETVNGLTTTAPTISNVPLTVKGVTNGINTLAYWKFDEDTGTTLNDATGNGYTGSFSGTTGSQWVIGKINSGLSFNGTNNFVSLGGSLSVTNVTVAAWIKTTTNGRLIFNAQSNNPLIYLSVGPTSAGGTNNKVVAYFRTLSGSVLVASGATNVTDGNWHYVAVVRNVSSQQVLIYVDGNLDSTISYTDTGTITAALNGIGGVGGGSNFSGTIDEVGIWNQALNATQISELYNSGNGLQYPFAGIGTTQTANLANFDASNGTILTYIDASGDINTTGTVTATTFNGSGAGLTSIGTTNMTAVTGTPSSTTFLAGNNTWATPSVGTGSLTGTVQVSQGGTSDTSLTAHAVMVGEGTSAVAAAGPGAVDTVLVGNGASSDPTFVNNPTLSGTITDLQTAIGTTSTDGIVLQNTTAATSSVAQSLLGCISAARAGKPPAPRDRKRSTLSKKTRPRSPEHQPPPET